jgi:FkbH-like protein
MVDDNSFSLSGNPFLSPSESLLFWKQNQVNSKDLSPEIKVGFVSTFTPNIISYHFSAELQRLSKKRIEISYAPFGQIRNAISFPEKTFEKQIDLTVVLWRLEDMYPNLVFNFLENQNSSSHEIMNAIAIEFEDLNEFMRTNKSGLILSSAGFDSPQYLDRFDFSQRQRITKLYNQANEILKDIVFSNARVTMINWEYLLNNVAPNKILDNRNDLFFSDPFSADASFSIGSTLGEYAKRSLFSNNKKLVILDCDNTLWGGVVGEDGELGIQLGNHGIGLNFTNFQRELKLLKNRGIMLALASKNNIDDVRKVFEMNENMVLRWEDFVNYSINWNKKSENIEVMCKELGISVNDSVFIDDSEFELAQVVEDLPQLSVLHVPSESIHLSKILRSSGFFNSGWLSAEDSIRTELYQHEELRSNERTKLSQEDFLFGLQLELTISKAVPSDLHRITQLINKTNQFNLTTVRRNILEIEYLANLPTVEIFVASAKDKFGSYGLIGVCIVDHSDDVNNIDTLLLSCRALGRGLEESFLAFVASNLIENNHKPVFGRYIENERNQVAKNFYSKLDFKLRETGVDGEYCYEHFGPINKSLHPFVRIIWKD